MVDEESGPEDKDVNKAPGSSLDLTLLITHCFCAASLQPAQVADEPTAAADRGGGCGRLRPSPWFCGPRPVPGSYYYQPFNARPSRSGLLERSLLAYLTSSAYQLQLTELRKPGCCDASVAKEGGRDEVRCVGNTFEIFSANSGNVLLGYFCNTSPNK